jgi:quercetin dioxygenase-like cupin family protein
VDSQPRTLVVRAGTGPRQALLLGRGSWESLVGDRVPPGALDVRRLTIEPGNVPGPLHTHRLVDNTYLVLEGELDVRAGLEQQRLTAGDAVFIPSGVAHSTSNPGERQSVLLAISDGPTGEDFQVLEAP